MLIANRSLVKPAKDKSRTNRLAYQVGKRKPRIFTEEVDEFMSKMCKEREGNFIWDDVAVTVNDEFNLAPGVPYGDATRKHCVAHGWKNTRASWVPYLTPRYFSDRAAWAKKRTQKMRFTPA